MKYVLGGGITGLVFAFINKDFKIICDKPLGQLQFPIPLGPRFIQSNERTNLFVSYVLSDYQNLGKSFFQYTSENYAQIGFEYDKLTVIDKCTNKFRDEYIKRTRGIYVKNEKSFLSEGQSSIRYIKISNFDYSLLVLANMLYYIIDLEGRIIRDKIELIDSKDHYIRGYFNRKMMYDKIVNTIDLNNFFYIFQGDKKGLQGKTVGAVCTKNYYVCICRNKQDKIYQKLFSYIYSISSPYNRKTYFGDYVCYESGYKNKKVRPEIDGNFVIFSFENVADQIRQSLKIEKLNDNIYMLGRFAQMDHSVKLQQVIDRSYKLKEQFANER